MQLIEDVLDVSRIVSGKIRLNVQPVNLSSVVDEAIASVQPALSYGRLGGAPGYAKSSG